MTQTCDGKSLPKRPHSPSGTTQREVGRLATEEPGGRERDREAVLAEREIEGKFSVAVAKRREVANYANIGTAGS